MAMGAERPFAFSTLNGRNPPVAVLRQQAIHLIKIGQLWLREGRKNVTATCQNLRAELLGRASRYQPSSLRGAC